MESVVTVRKFDDFFFNFRFSRHTIDDAPRLAGLIYYLFKNLTLRRQNVNFFTNVNSHPACIGMRHSFVQF